MPKIFLILLVLLTSCQAKTPDEQIRSTAEKVVACIRNGNETAFVGLIGVDLLQIGKNEEMVNSDFKTIKRLYDQYLKGKDPEITVTNEYDEVNSRKVVLEIGTTTEAQERIKNVNLELYFGPAVFVPLDRLANYKLKVVQDRGGPLPAPGMY